MPEVLIFWGLWEMDAVTTLQPIMEETTLSKWRKPGICTKDHVMGIQDVFIGVEKAPPRGSTSRAYVNTTNNHEEGTGEYCGC